MVRVGDYEVIYETITGEQFRELAQTIVTQEPVYLRLQPQAAGYQWNHRRSFWDRFKRRYPMPDATLTLRMFLVDGEGNRLTPKCLPVTLSFNQGTQIKVPLVIRVG